MALAGQAHQPPPLPTGGSFTAGTGTLVGTANSLTVKQTSQRAIVNFNQFSVGRGNTVSFQNGAGATLARVTGGSLTQILGNLKASGTLFLINPAGVIVDSSGVVVTNGSFVASTHDVLDSAFVTGGTLLFKGSSTAAVTNNGSITSTNGSVFLIARSVTNNGVITATQGTVGLEAGDQVLLQDSGEGEHVFVQASGDGNTGDATNTGAITAAQAQLQANGGNVYALAVNGGGTIRATGTEVRDGHVWLSATGTASAPAKVVANGTISAQNADGSGGKISIKAVGPAAPDQPLASVQVGGKIDAGGTKGGAITITGPQIGLVTGAMLTVSSTQGGGTILVGGDLHGGQGSTRFSKRTVTNAQLVTVAEGVTIAANATKSGAGGNVVVWSDQQTSFAGTIQAQGAGTGAGGFAEVSGKGQLNFTGRVNLMSASGVAGTLLLDPTDVVISTGTTSTGFTATSGTYSSTNNAAASTLNVGNLVSLLGSTNVIVTTSSTGTATAGGSIDIQASIAYTGSTARSLTLAADRSITLEAGVSISSTNAPLSVTLSANATNAGAGSVQLLSGSSIVSNGGNIQLGSLSYGAIGTAATTLSNRGIYIASATLNAGGSSTNGNITITGTGLSTGTSSNGIEIVGSTLQTGGSGIITLSGTGGAGAATDGVLLSGGTVIKAASGGISITGTAGTGGYGIYNDTSAGTVTLGGAGDSGSINLVADTMNLVSSLNNAFLAQTTGTAFVTGKSGNVAINLGTAADTAALELPQIALAAFSVGTLQVGANGVGGSGAVTITNGVTPSGVSLLKLESHSTISDGASGGVTVGALSILGDGAVTFAPSSAVNMIGTLGPVTAGGAFTLYDSGSLSINGAVSATKVVVQANTDLTLASGGSVAGTAAGYSVTLSAGRNFINSAGATAVTTGSGNFLIYSVDPRTDTQNGLAGTNVYGQTYTASPGTYGVAGNLFLHTVIPTLTVSVTSDNVYGATVPSFTQVVTGLIGGDLAASAVSGLATHSTTVTSTTNVGTYNIGVGAGTAASPTGYVVTFTDGSITVSPRPLTVTATDASRVYGAINPTFGYTVTGLANTDQFLQSPSFHTISGTATSVGTYSGDIIATAGSAGSNYVIASYVAGTMTVTQAPLSVMADNFVRTYGLNNPSFSATVVGATGGDLATDLVASLGLTSAASAANSVGTYSITTSSTTAGRLGNYSVNFVPGVLTVTQAALTVVAATTTRAYGDSNPTLSAALTGLTGADVTSTIVGLLSLSTSATTASPVGFYSIVAGNTTLTNYSVNFTGAQLVVTARPLTLTANSYSRAYGAADPSLSYSEVGLVNGDVLLAQPALALTSTLLPSSGVATYSGAVQISGAIANHNYVVTYQAGSVTVVPANLTVSANSVTRFYGSSNGALSAGFIGVTGGDTTSGLTTALGLVSNATTTSNVGSSYSITATTTTGGVLNNYSVTFTGAALTVTRAPLSVNVNAVNQFYGTGVPALSAAIAGATGADTSASLQTALALSAPAVTSATTVGTYAINVGNTTTGPFTNYTVTLTNASVVVSPRPITLTANDFSRIYGGNDPAYTFVATNFLNSDTLISQPTLSVTTTSSSSVGTYGGALHISGGSVGSNYTIGAYVAGSVTITQAALTVGVAAASRFYGAINPSFTATLTGVTGGDTPALLLTELALGATATASSASTTYAIAPTSLTAGQLSNYAITVNAGILTVAGAALTVSIDAKSRLYGVADPVFTASVQGVTGGDTVSSLVAALQLTAGTTYTTSVGTYTIGVPSVSNGPLANYAVTVNSASLTITPAPLTIVLNSASRFYGDSTVSYSAVVNGVTGADTTGGLIGDLHLSSSAISSSATGVYQINTGSLASGQLANYLVNYTGNLLTVTPRPLTIIAGDATRIYGGTDPIYTFTVGNVASFDTQATALLSNPSLTAPTASTLSPIGLYAINAIGGIASANYTITSYVTGNLTVTRAPLTVFIDSKNVIYDTAVPNPSATFSGNVESASVLTTALALSNTATSGSNTGTYAINVGTTSATIFDNYIVSVVPGYVYVIPQTLTVSGSFGNAGTNTPGLTVGVDDKTRVYGAANPSFTASIAFASGYAGTDTVATILADLSLTTTATTASKVGIYSIYSAANFATDPVLRNYAIDFTSGSLTVTPLAVTVTANSLSRVYGSVKFNGFGYTVSGLLPGETLPNAPAFSISNSTTSSTAVGTISGVVQLSGGGGGNYTIAAYVPGDLVITKAPLTVQVSPQSRYYGSSNPSLTALLAGVTGGDDTTALWTSLGLTTSATTTSNVGDYAITETSLTAGRLSNYSVTYIGANLTVKAAPLTLNIGSATTTYGAPTPSYSTALIGTTGSDNDAALFSALGVATSENSLSGVGVYFVAPTAITGGVLNNYVLTVNSGQITVSQRVLTVTVDNASRIYGASNPSLTFSATGFANGDTLSIQPLLTTGTTTNANVGTYAGDISAAGAYAGANYAINYVAGTLTITQATLSVAANSYTRFYGDTNPGFGASFTGITGADTTSSLTTALALTTTANTTTGVGTAAITSTGTLSNYIVSFTPGMLSITPRPLTITANDASHVYGSALPSLTYGATGLVNGDSLTVLPSLAATHPASANAGVYVGDIVASGAAAGTNYTVTSYIAGTMTVTQAMLTVSINSTSRLFGAVNPAFSANLNGLVNGDTAGTLSTALALGSAATNTSNVNTYAITAGGSLSNYSLVVTPGTLTVNPAPLVLTEVGQTLIYGGTVLPIGGSVSGVTGGNSSSQLLGLLALSTMANDSSGVGTYGIQTASFAQAVLSNYTITVNAANVVITPAALTIDVDNKTRLFGAADPLFTAGFTGIAGSDTPAGLLTDLSLSAGDISSTHVGTYTISGATSAGQLANYTITIHAGILSITPALLTVAVNPATRLYGALNPTLTATVTGATGGDNNTTISGLLSLTTAATTSSPVGNYAILSNNLTGSALANYSIFFSGNSLTVTPAPLSVTGLDYSRFYGAADPAFGANISGITGGDSSATMLSSLLLSAATTSNSSVGTYTIAAGQTHAGIFSNYTVTFTPGHLTITPAVLNIIGVSATRLYGAADPSFQATLSGVVGGDLSSALLSSLSFNAGDTSSTGVGTQTIVIGNTTSGVIGNYTIGTYTAGTLTINPAPLTVSALTASLVYGSTATRSFNASFNGLTGGDTAAILLPYLTLNSAATHLDPIGSTYTIVAGSTTAMRLANYTVSFNSAPLTITPAPLTITGTSYSRLYYTADPTPYGATITGVTANDSATQMVTDLLLQTATSQASNVGTYAISGVTTAAEFHNYTVTFNPGHLTITPQPLTVIGNNASRVYGDPEVSPYGATVTFATGADTTAALLSALMLSPGTNSASSVGTYAINITGPLTSSPLQNYAVTITAGHLTITPAVLTISVGDYSRTYGGTDPSFSASFTGLTGGDSSATLIGNLSLTHQTNTQSIGVYSILEGSTTAGRLSNYSIATYTAGHLTIGKALLTIVATDNTQIYGNAAVTSLTITGATGADTTSTLSSAFAPVYAVGGGSQPNVGTYTIGLTGTTTGGQLNNYTITTGDGHFIVTPRTLVVSPVSQTLVYNALTSASANFTANVTNFAYGQTVTDLGGAIAFGGSATTGINVATYSLTASGYTSGNYAFNYQVGTLVISPAPLTATVNPLSVAYNGSIAYHTSATFSYTLAGFVGGQTSSVVTGTPAYAGAGTTAKNVGTYSTSLSGLTSSNYAITYVPGNLTITPIPLTIVGLSYSRRYGDANPTFNATFTGLAAGDSSASLLSSLNLQGQSMAAPIGTYTITGTTTAGQLPNYVITFTPGMLTIANAFLTVTANSMTAIYGDGLTYGATITGNTAGDMPSTLLSDLLLAYDIGSSATHPSVGSYTITATPGSTTSGALSNYSITVLTGSLSITPRTLTVTAVSQTHVYTSSTFGFTATETNFASGEDSSVLTGSVAFGGTAPGSSNVGTYTVTPSGLGNVGPANYVFNYVTGTLAITPAPLTVAANNPSVVYNGSIAYGSSASFAVSYNGLLGSDSLSIGTIAYNAASRTAQNVGTYTITPSGLSGLPATNYSITYVAGHLTIAQAPLTVTANALSVTYSGSVAYNHSATFSVGYNGILGSDAASLGTISYAAPGTTAKNVGTYAITPSGLSGSAASNYSITYVAANLTIGQAPLTITAVSQTRTYTSGTFGFTVNETGFVGGETSAVLAGTVAYSGTGVGAVNVGSYSVTPSGIGNASAANYAISFVPGTLSITQAPLTVTANSLSVTYNGQIAYGSSATFASVIAGTLGSDAGSLGTVAYDGTSTAAKNASTYTITPSGLSGSAASNYSITYVAGNLTIGQAPLTITAVSQTQTYTSGTFGFTVNETGFVGGETSAVLAGTAAYSGTGVGAVNVGSYSVTPSGISNASAANYAITFVPGTLSITQAPLTVTANSLSVTYNGQIAYGSSATFASVIAGTLGSDAGSLGTVAYDGTSTAAKNASTYTITPSGLSGSAASNYSITYVAGNLTIGQAPLTITAVSQTQTYTSGTFGFTVNETGFVGGETSAVLAGTAAYSGTGVGAVNVGSYSVTPSGISNASAANYAITFVPGTLSITQAPLTVTANSLSVTYNGQIAYGSSATFSSVIAGTLGSDAGSLGTVAYDGTSTAAKNASTYTIAPSGLSGSAASNYSITYVAGNLTIGQAPLTITAVSQTQTYTSGTFGFEVNETGFVGGETSAVLAGTAAYSGTGVGAVNVGSYSVTPSGISNASAANYAITFVPGTLSITQAPLTVTANSLSVTYNGQIAYGSSATFGVGYNGILGSDAGALGTIAYDNASTAAKNAGSYAIAPSGLSGSAASNYAITYVAGNLTIGQAPLVVTANDLSAVYNGSIAYGSSASFSVGYVGIQGSDAGSLGTIAYDPTSTAARNVGSYTITPSGLSGSAVSNYAITYVSGNLSITPASLTVTANSLSAVYDGSIAYGGSATFGVGYTGLLGSDTSSVVTGTVAYDPTSTAARNVGSYTITPSGLAAANYTISYATGILAITPAPLTVMANNISVTYDGSIAYGGSATFGVAYSGLLGSDTMPAVGGMIAFDTISTHAKNAGSYAITPSGLSTSGASNYVVSYVSGTLSIGQAPLTVTANDLSVVYNGSIAYGSSASFSVGYNGILGSDAGSLGTIGYDATSTHAKNAGSYGITPSGLSGSAASNYAISYVSGNLSIGQAPLTVTANSLSVVYDGQVAYGGSASFGVAYAGLLGSDTGATIGGTIGYDPVSTNAKNAGSYTITPSGLAAGNYAVSYVSGSLSITPAALTVTANSLSVTYDGSVAYGGSASFGVGYTGFVGGETAAVLGGTLGYDPTSTAAKNAGSYTITPSGLAAANYTISYASGALTIGQAPLTVTANSLSVAYNGLVADGSSATFGYGVSGLLAGETAASVLRGTAGFGGSATSAINVGSYPITVGGLDAANYAVSFAPGSLSISPIPLTIAVSSYSRLYGGTDPSFAAAITGIAAGDTTAGLMDSLGLARDPGSNVGRYTISGSTTAGQLANYIVSLAPGQLTINPAPLTVDPGSASRFYGDANPALTATLTGATGGDLASTLLAAITLSTPATTTSNVGSYAISGTPGSNAAVFSNYTLVLNTGELDVVPRPLVLTAANGSVVYGSATPSLTYAVAGLVNGDQIVADPTLATDRIATSNVGGYGITIANGSAGSNYVLSSYVAGVLTVTPASLSVAIPSSSRVYGSDNPALTALIQGITGADDFATLLSDLQVGTSATSASNVGSYGIAPGSTVAGALANYTVNVQTGSLAITPATLTYVATQTSRTYGVSNGTLDGTVTGFVLDQTQATATTGTLGFSSVATAGSNVGTYSVAGSGLAANAGNYVFVQAPPNATALTVTPAMATVTAENETRVFGAPNPNFVWDITGLVNGDSTAVIAGISASSIATATSGPSTYPIVPLGGVAVNYDVLYVPGTLTVTPQVQTTIVLPTLNSVGLPSGGLPTSIVTAGFASFLASETESGAISGTDDSSSAAADAPAGAALEVAQSFGKFDIVYRQPAALSKPQEEAVVAVISAPGASDDPGAAPTPMITSSYTEANTAPGATNRIELSKTDADTRGQNDNGNARAAGSTGQ